MALRQQHLCLRTIEASGLQLAAGVTARALPSLIFTSFPALPPLLLLFWDRRSLV